LNERYVLHYVYTYKVFSMRSFNTYTSRELRTPSGELIQQGEEGNLDLNLFSSRKLTIAQAAKLAKMPMEQFISLLGDVVIDAVDYSPDEL